MDDNGPLSTGTRLGEFELRGLLGTGRAGFVYRAVDHDLAREVAIKEYLPGRIARRTAGGRVQPRGPSDTETFEAGQRGFLQDAQTLARFDHPALVKVFRYWEGNGTAYRAMPLYAGQTLAQALRPWSTPPAEAWLTDLLAPLLDALAVLHGQQIVHGDVSPDNLLLLRNGRPVLLDFGTAWRTIRDRRDAPAPASPPAPRSGYTAVEACADLPDLRQGPWTDLYALGAIVYACLTGAPPPPATARRVRDGLVPLAEVARQIAAAGGHRYSAAFLDTWQQALAVHPDDRPRSVHALRQRLGPARPPAPRPADDPPTVRPLFTPPHAPPPVPAPTAVDALAPLEQPATSAHGLTALALAGLLGVGVLGYLLTRTPSGDAPGRTVPIPAVTPSSAAPSRPAPVILDEAPEPAPPPAPAAKPAPPRPTPPAASAAARPLPSAPPRPVPAPPSLPVAGRPARTAPPAAPAPVPAPALAPTPARTLDDLCGHRVFIARDLCIQDACLTAEFARTAVCTELRTKAEEERIRKTHIDG